MVDKGRVKLVKHNCVCVHFRRASGRMNQSWTDDDVFRTAAAAAAAAAADAGQKMIEKIGGGQSHQ